MWNYARFCKIEGPKIELHAELKKYTYAWFQKVKFTWMRKGTPALLLVEQNLFFSVPVKAAIVSRNISLGWKQFPGFFLHKKLHKLQKPR